MLNASSLSRSSRQQRPSYSTGLTGPRRLISLCTDGTDGGVGAVFPRDLSCGGCIRPLAGYPAGIRHIRQASLESWTENMATSLTHGRARVPQDLVILGGRLIGTK